MMRRSYTLEEYERAMELLKKERIAEVSRITGIPYNTLLNWKHGKCKPPEAKFIFIAKPNNELAYLIGCLFGHVYIVERLNRIQLAAVDKEFVEAFSKVMSKLFNREYREPQKIESENKWIVYYGSKALCIWFKKQNLDSLREYIEYNKDTVKHFLRALYDSNGYNFRREMIHLYNRDINILKYAQYLLKRYFDIESRL